MATPSRRTAGGHYADASSPIASTPQRGRTPKPAPPTPSLAALSPMKQPKEKPLQRSDAAGAGAASGGAGDDGRTWTSAIFSPVLKFFGSEDEKAAQAAADAAAAEGGAGASAGAGGVARGSLTQLAQPGGDPRVGSTVLAGSPSGRVGAAAAPAGPVVLTAAVAAAGEKEAAAAAMAAGATSPHMAAPSAPLEYEEFNPYLFIKMLPQYHLVAPPVPRIALPKKAKRLPELNLILDLDETLVHCSVDPIPDADVTFPVAFNGANYQVYVRKRPHLDKFFALISGKFEVTVFTASQQVYAERLLNLLDPEGRHIHHRLYRDSCLNVDGNFLKDLNILGRDLTKTVLVDNSPHAFGYQLDNGIPIESWFDDKSDTELLKLAAFLHTLLGQEDVRPLVHDKFRLFNLVAEAQVPANW